MSFHVGFGTRPNWLVVIGGDGTSTELDTGIPRTVPVFVSYDLRTHTLTVADPVSCTSFTTIVSAD